MFDINSNIQVSLSVSGGHFYILHLERDFVFSKILVGIFYFNIPMVVLQAQSFEKRLYNILWQAGWYCGWKAGSADDGRFIPNALALAPFPTFFYAKKYTSTTFNHTFCSCHMWVCSELALRNSLFFSCQSQVVVLDSQSCVSLQREQSDNCLLGAKTPTYILYSPSSFELASQLVHAVSPTIIFPDFAFNLFMTLISSALSCFI